MHLDQLGEKGSVTKRSGWEKESIVSIYDVKENIIPKQQQGDKPQKEVSKWPLFM